jgi:uncharacterized membrane protein
MEIMFIVNFLFKWMHLLFGIAWIGLLYYFNFVQTEYFKEASPEGLSDAKAKLAPRALGWFRWAAMFTFITGVILLVGIQHTGVFNAWIVLGGVMGTLMFLNVWLIIWPNQKVVLGLAEGDAAVAGPKAALASRTNTLFSGPMAFCMVASAHMGYGQLDLGMWISLALIALVELNALFGKPGPIASIRGVIHVSLAFTAALFCLVLFL